MISNQCSGMCVKTTKLARVDLHAPDAVWEGTIAENDVTYHVSWNVDIIHRAMCPSLFLTKPSPL